MKKNARIEFRIPEGSKARWEGAAEGLGYPSLSAFIEDTIEQVHFASATGTVAPVVPIDVKEQTEVYPLMTTPIPEHVYPEDAEVALAKPAKKVCPGEAKHRKGTFCKQCKKVI